MKKQNGINKLAFNKVAVTELNDNLLKDVNGGSTPLIVSLITLTYAAGAGSSRIK